MKNLLLLSLLLTLFALPAGLACAAELPLASEAKSADDAFLDSDPFAAEDTPELQVYDPLEPLNRGI
ncbi:MAG: hypothetical protein R3336_06100, partial [Phycisphaeraceae bacterium]|nr:hypothetical protein [Phycisphaeraceae bacterium]